MVILKFLKTFFPVFVLFVVAAKLPAFDVVTAFGHHFLPQRPLPPSIQLKSRAKRETPLRSLKKDIYL